MEVWLIYDYDSLGSSTFKSSLKVPQEGSSIFIILQISVFLRSISMKTSSDKLSGYNYNHRILSGYNYNHL